jgi:hypothetical protein
MENIFIHTIADNNSIKYFQYMRKTLIERAKFPERLNFNVYFPKGENPSQATIKYFNENNIIFKMFSTRGVKGSSQHAEGLEFAFKNFHKNEINVFSDSDCAMCFKYFDVWVCEKLKNVQMIGTRYEDIGGPCVERNYPKKDTLEQTYKDKPNLIWCAISPTVDFSKISITAPNTLKTCIHVNTEDLSKMSGLPIGYRWWRDCAWEIARHIHENNISYYSFYKSNALEGKSPQGFESTILTKNYGNSLELATDKVYSEEYQMHDGKVFVIHQRGSRKFKFRTRLSNNFYNAYENFLKNNK